MSLRLRITLVVVAVVTVVVAVVGHRVHAAAEAELIEEVDLELEERARSVRGFARGPEFFEQFSAARLRGGEPPNAPEPDGFRGSRLGTRGMLQESTARASFTQVVSASGELLISLGESFSTDLALDEYPLAGASLSLSDGSVAGQRARVATVPVNDVFVQVARPLGEIDQSLGDLTDRIVIIALAAVVLAGGAAWLIAGGATAPIRRLTIAAEQVATTGDLDHPVDGSGGDEVGRLAGSFNAMLDALSTSRRQQRQLVMDASHELRTPLASLRTNVDVLRSGRPIPEDMQRAIVDDIGAEIDELGDLVAELVELASDIRDDEDPVPVDLADLVEPVAERQARRTDRVVDVVVAQRSMVEVRPTAVARAIRNLIENAAKFSPAGTSIRVEIDGGRVTVIDQGSGIPVAEREQVFERFHRVESTRTMPGSGLGLSIVRQVADAHGGQAYAGEAEGGGAAVTLDLPSLGNDGQR